MGEMEIKRRVGGDSERLDRRRRGFNRTPREREVTARSSSDAADPSPSSDEPPWLSSKSSS